MTHPSDILDYKSPEQHAREAGEATTKNVHERITDLERRIIAAAEEAGNLAENRTVGRALHEFARLIRAAVAKPEKEKRGG